MRWDGAAWGDARGVERGVGDVGGEEGGRGVGVVDAGGEVRGGVGLEGVEEGDEGDLWGGQYWLEVGLLFAFSTYEGRVQEGVLCRYGSLEGRENVRRGAIWGGGPRREGGRRGGREPFLGRMEGIGEESCRRAVVG